MCLAVPGKVVSINEQYASDFQRSAIVVFGAAEREVNLSLVPHATVGSYVLVHAGIAIAIVSAIDATDTLSILGLITDNEDE
jgi:hydrogenase expression/formation protein HypC